MRDCAGAIFVRETNAAWSHVRLGSKADLKRIIQLVRLVPIAVVFLLEPVNRLGALARAHALVATFAQPNSNGSICALATC